MVDHEKGNLLILELLDAVDVNIQAKKNELIAKGIYK